MRIDPMTHRPAEFNWMNFCAALAMAFWLALLGVVPAGAADTARGEATQPALVRIGIAPGTWWGVNQNDAKAAITTWARTIVRQHRIVVEVETRMFETSETMHAALKAGEIDAVTLLADQLMALEPELQPAEVFLGTKNHSDTERYVLLVHRSAGIDDVPGLAGRKLVLQASARTSLAPQWLDTLLARQSLGKAADVLGTLRKAESPSKAVLQVFFRQADGCLVTSNVFELACELNPQLRKELRVLAVSPEVIPSLFFFRPGYTSSVRDQLEPALLTLHETAAGLQVLTVFQSDGMVKRPLTCLEGTRQLLEEYDRTKRRNGFAAEPLTHPRP